MCACKPGNTCNYHTYANWPQDRKDRWNASRRARYAAKKNTAKEPVMSAEKLDNRDRAVLRGYHGQSLDKLNQHERRELFAVAERAGLPSVKSMKADEWHAALLKLKETMA